MWCTEQRSGSVAVGEGRTQPLLELLGIGGTQAAIDIENLSISKKMLFMDTEVWIAYSFHILQNIFVSLTIQKCKTIFTLCVVQKQVMGHICSAGYVYHHLR